MSDSLQEEQEPTIEQRDRELRAKITIATNFAGPGGFRHVLPDENINELFDLFQQYAAKEREQILADIDKLETQNTVLFGTVLRWSDVMGVIKKDSPTNSDLKGSN